MYPSRISQLVAETRSRWEATMEMPDLRKNWEVKKMGPIDLIFEKARVLREDPWACGSAKIQGTSLRFTTDGAWKKNESNG